MNRRELLKAAGWMTAANAAGWGQSPTASSRKPNILFILADDLGINGLSCYGSDKFQTPRIDGLAAGGTRYTNAYTAPLCGPSRALILTGRYAFRTGATNQDATGQMKPSVETMTPKLLKQAGYTSAMIGKWGQLPLGPAEFGFDEHLKFNGSGAYWNTQDKAKVYTVNGEKVKLGDHEYLPDLMHRYLVDFLNRHRNKPFFAYYSLSHVHAEILPTPDSAPGVQDAYADNIRYMDKLVGRVVDELDRLKLRENTLIVFFGDNGTGNNYADISTVRGKRLAGEKGSMLEGGANVPLILNWPGRTPAGKVTAELMDSTDLHPTFAELAGAKPQSASPIDGRSFVPQLQGKKGNPREWIFIQLARQWYVREAKFKLNQAGDLFDMSKAPFEEPVIPPGSASPAATSARRRLQAALDRLNPAGGLLDTGDGTGRHAGREENRKKKRQER